MGLSALNTRHDVSGFRNGLKGANSWSPNLSRHLSHLSYLKNPGPLSISACGQSYLSWQHLGSRTHDTILPEGWDPIGHWKLHTPGTGRATDSAPSLASMAWIEEDLLARMFKCQDLHPPGLFKPWDRSQKWFKSSFDFANFSKEKFINRNQLSLLSLSILTSVPSHFLHS